MSAQCLRLPNIMKPKKKPIGDETPADFGVELTPRLTVLKRVKLKSAKPGFVKVAMLLNWVDKLRK